jgi:hypothetical protein
MPGFKWLTPGNASNGGVIAELAILSPKETYFEDYGIG